ncbi:GNAT family N-acetyltransferase [Sediminibacillus albus]|uniref:Acetyltransferase (GNAT) domain-containing protein n=1 Tax=Sediminibacillus albus TaxID=407036 RepID=A0A1G9ANJ6_9BACI|nr:GNAT family N-acetyltransferase [Sediminibacillus albus]SDK28404.1 Acetyltransferase (GNAT) domain-containing protein [Sediminibacillus albus]
MIINLQHYKRDTAEKILATQLPAYQEEAKLIDAEVIPPLKDTVETIMNSKEIFLGYMQEDELIGVLAYENNKADITVSRLFVVPSHFRQGIAGTLLNSLLDGISGEVRVKVTTGTANLPAKQLYQKWGFKEKKQITVPPGIQLTQFEYHKSKAETTG